MSPIGKRKAAIMVAQLQRNARAPLDIRLWDRTRAVGREFGSPDFERLMEEDFRDGVGVFDPVLCRQPENQGKRPAIPS